MARFLFSVLPTRGHMYPSLPIAYALRAAGHEVAYSTVPEFGSLLEPQGIVLFAPQDDGDGAETAARLRRRAENATHRAAREAFRASFVAPVPLQVRALRRVTAEWQPDVLINDYVSFAPLMVAELEERPVATLHQTIYAWPGDDFGPFGLGLPRARGAAMRARYAALRTEGEAFFASVVDDLNAIRSGYALPPRHGPLAIATASPYLHILPMVPELDFNRDDLPPQAHYVGPCLFDPPTAPDDETARWLAALPPDQPLALAAASGAFVRSAGLVEAAIEGLNGGEMAVLATLPFPHLFHLKSTPAHIRVTRFVPHTQVLPRAGVVVAHGGFGTVTKALGYGTPLVVVPYAGDQPEVAQRVVEAGAGLRLAPDGLTPQALRGAVEAALHNEFYRANARRLAGAMARHDGPAEAAALLARLAASRQPILRTQSSYEPDVALAQSVGS